MSVLGRAGATAGALAAVGTVLAAAWGFGDAFGFRPALKIEVEQANARIETVANSVAWLQFTNLHNRLLAGGRLTPRECSAYRSLAAQFNVPPLPC